MKWIGMAVLAAVSASALADMPVVFPDRERLTDRGDFFFVESTIPGDFKTPEGVVMAMLALGDQVRNKDLDAPFYPLNISFSSAYEGALPLYAYLRGARIEGTTFIIAFDEEAMRYLNNTIAMQGRIKGTIEATILRNFPEIRCVAYEVDGKIVEEWDA
jgi:hypothetical protein